MVILGILGGLGAPEILIIILLAVILIASPFMWYQEWVKRRYWQKKAEEYERVLLNRK